MREDRTVGDTVVIDASNQRLGRMASKVAKMLLQGKSVIIVNSEKAVITGNKRSILERFFMLSRRKQKTSLKEVKVWYPNKPDNLVKYAIVRMLPRKKHKGKQAAKRLKVYVGTPPEYEGLEKLSFPEATARIRSSSGRLIRWLTMEEISKELGWKGAG